MYLTPDWVRNAGLGIDFAAADAPDDATLRIAIARASAIVDSICSVPFLPQKFDFRGGTMTDESHEWVVDMYETSPRPYRVYPFSRPIKTVSQLRIYSTPNVYTEIGTTELFINNSGGYVEVSSLKLTQFGIFGAGVITTLIGMFNPVSKLTYTYGWDFPVSGEILEPTDAYTYRAVNQWWATTPAPVVSKNGVVQSSGFTIDFDEGVVIFSAAQAATDIVTASYTHKLPSAIAQGTALVLSSQLGQSDLRAKGMEGLASIRAGEIELRRNLGSGGTAVLMSQQVSPDTVALLSPYIFYGVR